VEAVQEAAVAFLPHLLAAVEVVGKLLKLFLLLFLALLIQLR
jgi:hypothetical protein